MSRRDASTSNPFDALNMIDIDDVLGENGGNINKDDMVDNSTPNADIESLGAEWEETSSKVGKNKEGHLADKESESYVEEDDQKTASFLASKSSKGTSSSKSEDSLILTNLPTFRHWSLTSLLQIDDATISSSNVPGYWYFAFGRHLEENRDIGSFERKSARTTDHTNIAQDISLQWLEDGVTNTTDAFTTDDQDGGHEDSKNASEHTTQDPFLE
ncbi:hypothetical protein Tco_0646810 [Tanacetum coccineum]